MKFAIRWFALVGALAVGLFGVVPSSAQAPAPFPPNLQVPAYRFLIAGQSNAVGMSPTPQSWLARGDRTTYVPSCYYPNGQWGILCDPAHGGAAVDAIAYNASAGGSVWPHVARFLMPRLGPVAFIPCAKGGTSIGSWTYLPTGVQRTSRTLLYGSSRARGLEAGPVTLVLWWQGETDAKAGTPSATYASRLATLASWYGADLGCKVMPCTLQDCGAAYDAGEGAINVAITSCWGQPNIATGPDLSGISTLPTDDVHLLTTADLEQAGKLWAAAILAELQQAQQSKLQRRSQATGQYAMRA